jgi:hypothetical protein
MCVPVLVPFRDDDASVCDITNDMLKLDCRMKDAKAFG